jgi:hypothetical protein
MELIPPCMELIPLCIAHFEVNPPIQFGKTPTGQRSQSDIRSATFEGERLRATLAGTASDWLVLAGDIGTIDVRMALKTHDGALIGLRLTSPIPKSAPRGSPLRSKQVMSGIAGCRVSRRSANRCLNVKAMNGRCATTSMNCADMVRQKIGPNPPSRSVARKR